MRRLRLYERRTILEEHLYQIINVTPSVRECQIAIEKKDAFNWTLIFLADRHLGPTDSGARGSMTAGRARCFDHNEIT